MVDYMLFVLLLVLPFLVNPLKTDRTGLVTGFFVSIFFWSKVSPILALVPFGVGLWLYFDQRLHNPQERSLIFVKNPSMPVFMFFVVAVSAFCALQISLLPYGKILNISPAVMEMKVGTDILASIIGPIVLGSRCDRKGPFGSAVVMALMLQISVWLTSAGMYSDFLFLAGSFLLHMGTAGFYAVMPLMVKAFFGPSHFRHIYPSAAFASAVVWISARVLYTHRWSTQTDPGSFLISLSILSLISAAFLCIAWRRRLTLVSEGNLQKTS